MKPRRSPNRVIRPYPERRKTSFEDGRGRGVECGGCGVPSFFLHPRERPRPPSNHGVTRARRRRITHGRPRHQLRQRDGVWWSIETVSTVGYGDIYPTTVQGRLIALVLMFVGIGFLSLLTAAVASRFVKQERGEEHQELMETLRRIEADVAELKSLTR
jgi:hypothetical protein